MRVNCLTIWLMLSLVSGGAGAQAKTGAAAAAVAIYEDLPLDKPAKISILKPNESIAQKIRNNLFIKTTLSKKTCFAGEPLLLTYELYSALQNKSVISKRPSFKGFTVRAMESLNEEDVHQQINGQDFRVFTVARQVIMPYETGNLDLEPLEIQNTISYDDATGREQQYDGNINSGKQTVTVLPLPAPPAGSVFCGAVGQFAISIKADRPEMLQRQSSRVMVEIFGKGNLANLTLPAIRWPKSFELFPESEKLEDSTGDAFSSRKRITLQVVGKEAGQFSIAPIQLLIFNPAKKAYETISSAALPITVLSGGPAANTGKPATDKVTKSWSGGRYGLIAAVLAMIAMLWLIVRAKKRRMVKEPDQEAPEEIADLPAAAPDYPALVNAALQDKDDVGFIQSLRELIRQYAVDKTSLHADETDERLLDALALRESSTAAQLKELMATCNHLLYSPAGITAVTKEHMARGFLEILHY